MTNQFNPYRKWLGIPSVEQPPNYYRLLGIGLFETDADVIAGAADRQMAHVRTFQTGRYSHISQKVLNELAAAQVCLLNTDAKRQYDLQLKQQMGVQLQGAPPQSFPPQRTYPQAGPPVEQPAVGPVIETGVSSNGVGRSRTLSTASQKRKKRSSSPTLPILIVSGICVIVILVLVVAGSGPKKTATPPASKQVGAISSGERKREPTKPKNAKWKRVDEEKNNNKSVFGGRAIIDFEGPIGETTVFEGHDGRVNMAVFLNNGRHVVSAGDDETMRLWSVETGQLQLSYDGVYGRVVAVAVAPDGKKVIASTVADIGGSKEAVRVWQTTRREFEREVEFGDSADANAMLVRDIKFSIEGYYAYLAGEDGSIRELDVERAKESRSLEGSHGAVLTVDISRDDETVISGARDGTVVLWRLAGSESLFEMRGHRGAVNSVAFSPSQTVAASGSEGKNICIWNLGDGHLSKTFIGHTDAVTSVVFSNDGKHLLSASMDGTIRVWRVDDGKQVHRFNAHKGGVASVRMADDGSQFVSAGLDGIVRLWAGSEQIEKKGNKKNRPR